MRKTYNRLLCLALVVVMAMSCLPAVAFATGTPGRIGAFVAIVWSLWVLFGVLSPKDLRWLRGLIGKK